MPDLLIELFSEEIPARMQAKAAADLQKLVTNGLVDAGLTYTGARAFWTPRRLTVAISDLLAHSPTTREERKGPKADAPDKAVAGFLRSTGLTRDQLETRSEKKGEILYAVIEKAGRPAAEIIADVLEATIRTFPWPKSMRWGAGTLRWVRPLQAILCVLSDEAGCEIVPLDVDGIVSGNTTRGHRFLSPEAFAVRDFEDYSAQLRRAHVVLDAAERADMIWADATNQAFALGLAVVEDKALLAEIAGLVEWPVVLLGKIDEDFLALPPEVLQTSMREHQKFFSVMAKSGQITHFITVANTQTFDHGATILAGNQKVLAARLADAKFFWENDLRVAEAGAQPWLDALANVTFHNKLGSQAERITRIAALARNMAPMIGTEPDLAEAAARFVKVDLSSEMVYEFPELQGVMGKYYAKPAGHPSQIAEACIEHYQPLGPSDDVPSAPVSIAVALADKIDTLTGFWAIDEKPTGSKDPFALRRAALGVIRLVLENKVRVSLVAVVAAHLETFEPSGPEDVLLQDTQTATNLLSFFHDRLKVFLKDKGICHDVIDACLAMPNNDDLTLLVKRAEALSETLSTEDGENLIQGFKRAANILGQAETKDGVEYSFGAEVQFAETDAERALFTALDSAEAAIAPALQSEDFRAAMSAMARLRTPIDAFFTSVQVNADSQVLRRNRLNLLHRIRATCGQVAALAKIEG